MSTFRSLAPSNHQAESSASPLSSGQRLVAPGSIRGIGYVATPKDSSGGSGSGGDGNPRKRRTAGSVSLMACTPCRGARQRCDGHRPESCSRCSQRRLECVYEPHTKTHKDGLIREIEGLRGDNANLQSLNRQMSEEAAESDSRTQELREEGAWQRIILGTIGKDGYDQKIVAKLRAGESHHVIADWLVSENSDLARLGHEPGTDRKPVDVAKFQDPDGLLRSSTSESEIPWTNVSTNQKLIGHLLDLYFTWVHPVHMLFSETEFKKDFKHSQETHCSASLVNAICAMACNLHESEVVRDRRNVIGEVAIMREGFMTEAKRKLSLNSYGHMTSIQTFAVMYLVELSSGRARNAAAYLRSAVDNMESRDGPQQSEEARELTLLGIQTLNTAWAGMTYQRLYTAQEPKDPNFRHVRLDTDNAMWRYYRHPGDGRELPVRPSYAMLTACHQARLFRIVNDCLIVYCGIRGRVNASKVLEIYCRYQGWNEELPAEIAGIDKEEQPLPHVLYIHVQYHTVIVQLFLPLLYGSFFSGDDEVELRRLILYHARSGVELLDHVQHHYGTRFLTPLMSFCLIHLCDTLVRFSPQDPPAATTVTFCIEALQQARAGFAVTAPLQALFCREVENCGVKIPDSLKKIRESVVVSALDDLLDACLRLEYTQPHEPILRHFHPDIAKDWHRQWESQVVRREKGQKQSSSGEFLRIDNILNS